MPILLKIIGCINNHELYDKFTGDFTINAIISILNKLNISDDDIHLIKFLTNNKSNTDSERLLQEEPRSLYIITNYDEILTANCNEVYNIYIYSSNNDVKLKLETMFSLVNNESNNELNNELNINCDITLHNKATIELLKNESFKTVLKLYINNSSIFSTFIQFITFTDDVDIIELNTNPDIDYNNLVNIISKLELGFSDDDILIKLRQYNGHLNLTLRSLISNL
jgi:hypothetical protein